MRRFEGSRRARGRVVLMLALMVVTAGISVALGWLDRDATAVGRAGSVLFAAVILFLGWAAVRYDGYEAWTAYLLDDLEIRKRSWLGEEQMAWDAVQGYSVRGAVRPTYRLSDALGRMLTVRLSIVDDSAAMEALLKERLRPATERMLHEMGDVGRTLYPDRGLFSNTIALFACGLFLLVPAVLFSAPHPDDPPWAREVAAIVCGAAAVALALYAAHLYVRQLRIGGHSVEVWTPWRSCRIDLAALRSIERTGRVYHGRAIDSVTLRGCGQTICLSSATPDFVLVVEHLRASAPQATYVDRTQAPADPAARQHWLRHHARRRLAGALLVGALGLFLVVVGGSTLLRERALDVRGVPATGRVIRLTSDGLRFAFAANDKLYEGRSQTAHPDLAALRVGSLVDVVYLPDNPRVARASISNAARRARIWLVIGSVEIVLAVWLASAGSRQRIRAKR